MKRLISILFILVLSNIYTYGQGKYGHATPQTADFMISGKFPVSMYTGKLNISIPIYNIKDPDFDHPITASYNSDGFKPHKHAGVLGYNWILNVGGCITREVANMPDEYNNVNNDINYGTYGFLALAKRVRTYSKNDIFNFSNSVGVFRQLGTGHVFDLYNNSNQPISQYEYMPDVFSFNFNGKSGQFIFGNDGMPKLLSDEWFHIDTTGIKLYQPQSAIYRCLENTFISSFIITDMNGYKYYFGGTIDAIEYSIIVDCSTSGATHDNSNFYQDTPTTNAWYLTKIEAPNGRTMDFHYKASSALMCYDNTDPLWQYRLNRNGAGEVSMNATKSAILEKITITDIGFEVNFNLTTDNTRKLYNINSQFNNANYRLSSVVAAIDGEQLCNVVFEPVHYGGDSSWGYRFLKSIRFNASLISPHQYEFSYDTSNQNFPNPVMISRSNIDDFGYWRANNFWGLLKSVIHPTGGRSEFEYEPHNYGTKRYYEYSNINNTAQITSKVSYTAPMLIGGVRLRSIKNYMNDIQEDYLIYNYSSKFDLETPLANFDESLNPGQGSSHGCLQTETDPIHNIITSRCRTTPSYQGSGVHSTGVYNSGHIAIPFHPYLVSGQLSDVYNIGEPHVGYREVTEIAIDIKSDQRTYKTYTFTDYLTNPDVKASSFSTEIGTSVLYSYQNAYSSMSLNRGKLLSEIWRNSNKEIVYEVQNNYSHNFGELIFDIGQTIIDPDNYTVSLRNIGGFTIAKKIYHSPSPLISREVTEFAGSSEIKSTNSFDYDEKQRVIETRRSLSNGMREFTEYKYPDQILGNISTVPSDESLEGIYYLKMNNIISRPIEVKSGLIDGNVKKVTSAIITSYKKITNFKNNISSVPLKQFTLRVDSPIENYSPLSVNASQLAMDNRMKEAAKFEHSNRLRLTSIMYPGEPLIMYVWDTKNMYPIKETQGNLTHNYTYRPMVGLSIKQDPRGVYTYYEYDALGRLISIKDHYSRLIQKYDYNYKNTINQ